MEIRYRNDQGKKFEPIQVGSQLDLGHKAKNRKSGFGSWDLSPVRIVLDEQPIVPVIVIDPLPAYPIDQPSSVADPVSTFALLGFAVFAMVSVFRK